MEGMVPATTKISKAAYCREWREKNKGKVAAYNLEFKEEITARKKEWAANNKEYMREYYEANKERLKAERDEEKHRAYSREYHKANKETRAIYNKAWREANPSKAKAGKRAWTVANPDKVRDMGHAKRARDRNATIEVFSVTEIYERDGWICQLCKKKVNRRLKYPNPLSKSLDHIVPLSKGGAHSRANVHLAHLSCNVKALAGGVKQLRLM
uniref:Putative homing endonuclease n=1 Tax=viral metagenome TaxID=1070528 RepID=A0A6H1ZSI7_9ZZZZ